MSLVQRNCTPRSCKQLRTGIAEVTGLNPVETLNFFQASLFQMLKLEIHCDDHLSLSYTSTVHIIMNHFVYITSVVKQLKKTP